jgi:methanogenic corrinoid protein MtbC1
MDQASDGRGSKSAPGHSAGALKEAASEDRLLPLVETEIIPRLMMAHQDQRLQAPNAPAIATRDVVGFAKALMENRVPDANDIVADIGARGISMDKVYLDLFAPAARYLGELWEADLCTFSEVTLCLWRLQTLLYDLSPAFHSNAKNTKPAPESERRIVMATMPGQQHTFGLSMLSEFFRREGWVVLSIPSPKPGELQDALSANWFDVLALSVSTDNEFPELGKAIRTARKTSRNPRLSVMVGGPLFLREPGLAATAGADGCSSDAVEALALALQLIQQQQDVRMN